MRAKKKITGMTLSYCEIFVGSGYIGLWNQALLPLFNLSSLLSFQQGHECQR